MKRRNNRFLAGTLAGLMMLTMLPVTALAAEENGAAGEPTTLTTENGANAGENGAATAAPTTGGENGAETGGSAVSGETGGEQGGAGSSENGASVGEGEGGGNGTTEGGGSGTTESGGSGSTEGSGSGTTEQEKPETPVDAAKIVGKNEYASIAEAIDAAQLGDTIVLLHDVTENIEINRSLTLDLNGFTLTGNADAAVVTISGDKPQVTVKNGTVTGGTNPQNGGGFAIDSAVVQLEDLTITGNETVGGNGNGEVGGGGIYASHADVSMQNVTVSENSVTGSSSDGGGILVRYGSLTMDGCHVERNTAPDCGGGMLLRHSVLNAAKSFFENNTAKYGAGIYLGDTPNEAEEGCSGEHNHLITDSTISGNTVLDPENGIGGGMYVGTTSNLTLRNSKL